MRAGCWLLVGALGTMLTLPPPGKAEIPTLGSGIKPYVKIDAPVLALVGARVIDGTGAPTRDHQVVILRDGMISAVGPEDKTAIPPGAKVLDARSKTIIPGLVMMHEHLFYPTAPANYAYVAESFTRLYLAGGVTSMRTAGALNGYGEIGIKRSIDEGSKPGPWIDVTAPYLVDFLPADQFHRLSGPDDVVRTVNFWADAGATSFKAYMTLTRQELKAAIEAAHARHLKITGHLCSVTLREAAQLGIDNLEHSIIAASDFVANKDPDACPGQGVAWSSVAAQDPRGDAVRALLRDLVAHHVAMTSTLSVFEVLAGESQMRGQEVLDPVLRESLKSPSRRPTPEQLTVAKQLVETALAVDREFVSLGGLLMAGSDPSVGGVIPGFADQHEIELLVQRGGFSVEEAIRICSLNAAIYLGRADRIGSITAGKQADLVVIDGDPTAQITDIRRVETVFKQGVGYDPAKLIDSVSGKVGLF